MSSNEQTLASLISQLALSLDGAVLGTIVAFAAIDSFLSFKSSSSALRKLRQSPSVKVSDLRSLVLNDSDQPQPSDAKLVVLRGHVQAKSAVEGIYKSLKSSAIVNPQTNENTFIDAVIIQRTQRVRLTFSFIAKKVSVFDFISWHEIELGNLLCEAYIQRVEGLSWVDL